MALEADKARREHLGIVVMLGEIGGDAELEAARLWSARDDPKPLIAYVAGPFAREAKLFGHAGAIVRSPAESARAKSAAFAAMGVLTAPSIIAVARMVIEAMAAMAS
jgi:succinyl-CoA synthetase alpha subunit